MSDNKMQFRTEGQPAFPTVANTEEGTSADSSSEIETKTDTTQSSEGANTQNEDNVPFHKHPAWQRREEEWNSRFNEQEKRHQDDLQKIREEFSNARRENAEQEEIPAWFGGNKEQWDAYRAYEDSRLKKAQETALREVTQIRESQQEAARVKEATDYMQSEMAAIESDKSLNPTGERIDPNALLKFVLDNDLVDSQGRWNYRVAWRLMRAQTSTETTRKVADRKAVAGATTSESRGETKPNPFKTSADFKKKKPW